MNKNFELLRSMVDLKDSLYNFITELENFEKENNIDINDLIVEEYPFDKDLYETHMDILDWLNSINDKLKEEKKIFLSR